MTTEVDAGEQGQSAKASDPVESAGRERTVAAPRRPLAPPYRAPRRFPYWFVAIAIKILVRCYLRVRVEGSENLPAGPALLAFNHSSWTDPFVLVAALPSRPDLVFVGPQEEDMSLGARNRLITWSGRGIPFRPARSDLRDVARGIDDALATGAHVLIAPEGRIHAGERELLPLSPGAAWFALHAGVPLVPVGTTGLGWVRFGRTVRVRIGRPIVPVGRPGRAAVETLSADLRNALLALVADGRNEPPPGPVGRWVTELFNDWPEGGRPEIPTD